MARFLIGTTPIFGHVNPTLPIVRKLVERGHEVWWYSGEVFKSRVEATGARYVPMVSAFDYSDLKNVPKHLEEEREALPSESAKLVFDFKHFLLDLTVGHVKDFQEILRQFPADVLLSDCAFLGASWVYEKGGPIWATLGVTALFISSQDTAPHILGLQPNSSPLGRLRNNILNWVYKRVLLRNLTSYMNDVRASIGLPPTQKDFVSCGVSPFLYLQQTIPAFEYPRSDLPPQVHFIGPSLPKASADFTFPSWWEDLKGNKPVILVTQGTLPNDKTESLIVPTIEALADEDVLVVATTGGQRIKLDQYPANTRIEDYIPYSHLMPHVDIVVTNGGYNGVQEALAHGVPVVTAGTTEDKSEACARVQWSGVGINLKNDNPTPKQITDAVKKILATSHYRQKAQLLQAEISCYNTPTLAATLLEQLAATQQPVFREQ